MKKYTKQSIIATLAALVLIGANHYMAVYFNGDELSGKVSILIILVCFIWVHLVRN